MFERLKFLSICLLTVLAIGACGSNDEREKIEQPSSVSATTSAEIPVDSASPPPVFSPEDRKNASKVIDFYNNAFSALTEGYYSLANVLYHNVREYQREWQLTPRPEKHDAERRMAEQRLLPPNALFSDDVQTRLTQFANDMNESLGSMVNEYKALQKYVKDETIQDDGVGGEKLCKRFTGAYAAFSKARDGYFTVIEAETAQAEDVLLQGHPLKRQILASKKLFSLFRTVAFLFTSEHPEKAGLEQVREDLETAISDAARPPFNANPEIERTFRAFIGEAQKFLKLFTQGLSDGFTNWTRREMNEAMKNSKKIYNDFVTISNKYDL